MSSGIYGHGSGILGGGFSDIYLVQGYIVGSWILDI